jgi:hypothetical protein
MQGEKIVNNNLQLDRLKLLLNEVLIALSSSKNNVNSTIRLPEPEVLMQLLTARITL